VVQVQALTVMLERVLGRNCSCATYEQVLSLIYKNILSIKGSHGDGHHKLLPINF